MRQALRLATAIAVLALLAAACGMGTRTSPTTPATSGGSPDTSASAPAGSVRVTVTVPGLSTANSVASPLQSGVTEGAGTAQTPASSGTGASAPTDAPTAAATATPPTSTAGSASVAGTTPGATTPGGSIDLSACAGCTVIATHAAVVGSMSAALATAPRGAVLLAVRPDGSVAGVVNVPYGASLPAPAGGSLPCDRSGRCIVTARQADGNAVLSAFQLASDGTWRDVSGNNGFPSATPRGLAVDVTGDGLLDIAVQESAGNLKGWLVLSWSAGRFSVLGCAPDSAEVPPAAQLSKDVCLS